jgi:glycosyltransferase involved in cell wall biosynthesis
MKSLFIGHFSPSENTELLGNSSAGTQVQKQILHEMIELTENNIICYAMSSIAVWPRGKFISKSVKEKSIEFIGFINLPVVKHIIFSLRLFKRISVFKPELCLQYNSYLFENIILLAYKFFNPKIFLVLFIQDVNIDNKSFFYSKRKLISLFERLSIALSNYFDVLIPISIAIIKDFNLSPAKSFVFQGGVTNSAIELMKKNIYDFNDLENIGVFAGALEKYNGIDALINQWLFCDTEHKLHIFGRGSLEYYVKNAAMNSNKIVFHGLKSQEVILEWQLKARWNFCLRYSIGLNQNYFFPSKFFNILCAPGSVVVNDFQAIPASVREFVEIVSDDLSDLSNILNISANISSAMKIEERRELVLSFFSWKSCIEEIVRRFLLFKNF